jgi:hypothetical protein
MSELCDQPSVEAGSGAEERRVHKVGYPPIRATSSV